MTALHPVLPPLAALDASMIMLLLGVGIVGAMVTLVVAKILRK